MEQLREKKQLFIRLGSANIYPVSRQQSGVSITYYTDPLCCWSWAFEKQWQKIRTRFKDVITWQYCMGGLLPGWNLVNSINRPLKVYPMWMHAAEHTGAAISHDAWMNDPPASSYPGCIAVKSAGLQSQCAEELYLFRLREACMLYGKDITKADVLLEIAHDLAKDKSLAFNEKLFKQHLLGNEGMDAFRKDLQQVKYRGVKRFPSLLIKNSAGNARLMTGYQTFETISPVLDDMIDAGF